MGQLKTGTFVFVTWSYFWPYAHPECSVIILTTAAPLRRGSHMRSLGSAVCIISISSILQILKKNLCKTFKVFSGASLSRFICLSPIHPSIHHTCLFSLVWPIWPVWLLLSHQSYHFSNHSDFKEMPNHFYFKLIPNYSLLIPNIDPNKLPNS